MKRCAIVFLAACGSGAGASSPDAAPAIDAACVQNGSTNPYAGQIVLTSTSNGTYAITAAFTAAPSCVPQHACTMSVDRCCYMAGPNAAADDPPVSAGVLTVAGATTMTPSSGRYMPVANPPTTSLVWGPESNVVIDAAGDTVHTFETQVTTPGVPTGINPAIASISIPRANNFDVSWQQGNGLVTLELSSTTGTISCGAYPDNGVMDVPAALLANFKAGDTGTISLTRTYSVVDSPDNADVLTSAHGVASGTASYP